MQRVSRWIRALAPILAVALWACGRTSASTQAVSDDIPADVVAAHSSGLLSRAGPVQVRFAVEVASTDAIGTAPGEGSVRIEPAVAGTWTWASRQVLEFAPTTELAPGQRYQVIVAPALLAESWKDRAPFRFDFGVTRPAWSLVALGVAPDREDGAVSRWSGRIELADRTDPTAVESMLVARYDGATPTVSWVHGPDHAVFTVTGLTRGDTGRTLSLDLTGSRIGADRDEHLDVPIPGLDHFVVASIAAITAGERSIEIRFSDPLDASQDLRGLVRVVGRNDVRIERDANVVRLYASANWAPREEVEVSGVRNARGRPLSEPVTQAVAFESVKPGVRFVGSGVVLPSSADPVLALEVANARAVEVEAFRVYEANVPQFLQVNALDGTEQLERVGTRVWRSRVEVPQQEGAANRWVRVGLDASELVRKHPQGLYRLEVHVRRSDVLWDCAEPAWEEPEEQPENPWDGSGGERSFWDLWGSSADEGWWDWDHREDPCHKAYYRDFSWQETPAHARRNLIVSDVGLTARQGADGRVDVVATHLGRGEPLGGVELTLLDYQLQPLAKGRTDAQGMLRLATTDAHPFALVGSLGESRSWLRLDRSEALSTAHLDVGGAAVHRGQKGLIYGERGVWRPGDPLFLHFVLFDALDRVPDGHPIEFQLRDPQGSIADEQTITTSIGGFYAIRTRTAPDAPTGRWSALVRVGGAVFQQSLRIEAVMPNRLKIDLPLPADGLGADDLTLRSRLAARWLHGATARGLAADLEVAWAPRPTRFDRYAEFQFDAPDAQVRADPEIVWEGRLDDAGNVDLGVPLVPPSGAPGLLTATLRSRVFEPGGASSTSEATLDVAPYQRFLGVALPKGDKARNMLLTDVAHPVRIVALDRKGRPAGNGDVAVSIHKLSWRWWWEQGDGADAEYAESEEPREIASAVVPLVDGVADWTFEVKYPDWGRYLVTARDVREGGHQTGQIVWIDWPGWAGRAQKDGAGGATQLALTADVSEAEVGREVALTFPMPKAGRAFVSLLTGTRVLSTAWVAPSNGDTATYRFVAQPEMAPGVYAQVTVVQPYGSGGNDAPLRLYGIVPVRVTDPATRLAPQIATAPEWRPAETAMVSVSEAQGREMTYTLAVVDEGLLGLTRYRTPDPWDSFYAREALGVRTWDLFDDVSGAYGGTLEQLLAIGGGDEGELGNKPKAQRFPPVVWVDGPFHLAAGATDRREVTLPHYVGEVRVMVVAGHQAAFGRAEASVPVRAPLMALATLPRQLGPGEQVELPVSLFSSGGVREVDVTVQTEGPIRLEGAARRAVRFDAPGEQMATFRLVADEGVGDDAPPAKVRVLASGGGHRAPYDIEIEVAPRGPPVTRVATATIAPGARWTMPLELPGTPGSTALMVEVSRVPPLDLDHRLDALIRYPHGCVEQTTSAAFPQVALDRLVDLSPAEQGRVTQHVRAAIERLRGFQGSDGGFGTWPGNGADPWSTSWVGHFLMEAERGGYALPSGMRASWIAFQRATSDRWVLSPGGDGLDQAYRLYTLSLAGAPDIGAMNRLRDLPLSDAARWRLAAAWAFAGRADTAREIASSAGLKVRSDREMAGTLGSPLRDRALMLEALVVLGDLPRATSLAAEVSDALVGGGVLATHEAAWALVSLSRFADRSPGTPIQATVTPPGAKGIDVATAKAVARVPVTAADLRAGPLVVANASGGPLFATATLRGRLPPGSEGDASQGLAVSIRYEDLRGNEILPDRVEQGTDFVAAVEVRNTTSRRIERIALQHGIPGGWEVHGIAPGRDRSVEWRDVRDDRVASYFSLDADASLDLRLPLTASYLGRFAAPVVLAEAMYDPAKHGRVAGQWVEVVSQRVD